MNNFSFEIKTSKDLLRKLIIEVSEYELQLTSSRHAINAAMTAWHIVDWIYYEFNFTIKYPKVKDFRSEIKLQYPRIQIMEDIANGSKHFRLTYYTPEVNETKLKQGSYSDDYSRDYDTSRLQVVFNNETFDFIDELENVREFWKEYFKNTLDISIGVNENEKQI